LVLMSRTLLIVLSVVALVSVALATGTGASSFVTYLNGGLSFCSQCGANGQYACSANNVGNYSGNYTFQDPVPAGSVAVNITVTLRGSYACNIAQSTVQVNLNDQTPINILPNSGSNSCACNTCDGYWTFQSTYSPFDVPAYAYGGINKITLINLAGSICLNSVNITVAWEPPVYAGSATSVVRWTMNKYNTYQVCNTIGYDSSQSMYYQFADPLPKGALLIIAGVQYFGSFWCGSSSTITPQITATLVNTYLGTIKLPGGSLYTSNCAPTIQCDGNIWSSTSIIYQQGWPNYVYGGNNALSLSTSYSPRLGRVILYLGYIMLGNKEQVHWVESPTNVVINE